MTTPIPPEKQTKFILVGATGKLGRSISSHNAYAVSYTHLRAHET